MSLKITEETTFLLDMTNAVQYGPVLNVSNCENSDYTTFGSATPTGFDATSNGGATHNAGTADEIVIVSSERYFVDFNLVLNSGTAPSYDIKADLGGAGRSDEGIQLSTNGANIFTFTASISTTAVLDFFNLSVASDFEITNLSVRHIL